jgi:hypothetical protein
MRPARFAYEEFRWTRLSNAYRILARPEFFREFLHGTPDRRTGERIVCRRPDS